MADTMIKEINYGKFGRCVQISNGTVDLVVTVDVGPRIIRFGFLGKENEFCEDAPSTMQVGEDTWRLMGGHRLWHSPEYNPRTYMPDNDPVEWEPIQNGIRTKQKVEPWVQIQKEMEITLCSCCNRVKVMHRLTNSNAWPVELSLWAITVMATGGKEFVPQPQRETGFLANRNISLWPYSRMNDHRVHWGDRYIVLQQDPNTQPPFKFGITNEDGWAAYFNHGNMFIKRYNHKMDARYPDFGVSYETYTTDFMLEMESLSPVTLLDPGASVEHGEEWELIQGVSCPSSEDESEMDALVQKYIMAK